MKTGSKWLKALWKRMSCLWKTMETGSGFGTIPNGLIPEIAFAVSLKLNTGYNKRLQKIENPIRIRFPLGQTGQYGYPAYSLVIDGIIRTVGLIRLSAGIENPDYLKKIFVKGLYMKKSMSREHADLLKRCYMSMGLNHDLMLGVQSRKAQAYDLLADIHTQVNTPRVSDCSGSKESHHGCHCANS